MERKKIELRKQRNRQDSFMPRPEYCKRGTGPIFNRVVCVDIVICEYYCDEDCFAYEEFVSISGVRRSRIKRR